MSGKRQQLSKAAGSERIRSNPRHLSLLKSSSKEFILSARESSMLRVPLWPTARDQLMVRLTTYKRMLEENTVAWLALHGWSVAEQASGVVPGQCPNPWTCLAQTAQARLQCCVDVWLFLTLSKKLLQSTNHRMVWV